MQVLLVVDIDHGDGWSPDRIERDNQRTLVAEEVKKVLEEKRAKNEIIVFIVLTHVNGITGQEAQLASRPQNAPENSKSRIIEILDRLKNLREARPRKCIVCDELPENSRLAPFLEHCHKAPFEPAFIKRECNAFGNQQLAPYLRSLGVDEVVLAGCNTFACVLETAIGALKAGFNITLLEKCAYPPFDDTSDYSSRQEWIQRLMGRSQQSKFTAKII